MLFLHSVVSERTILNWIRNWDFSNRFGRGLKQDFGSTFGNLETYGCNCHALISGKSATGKPVDELDTACQEYLSCSKCVRKEIGESCDQNVPYILGFTNFETSFYRYSISRDISGKESTKIVD